eukprot:CAMPEP_0202890652 /NCGR_PEP_ID=MMETSP1392-20130828/992_1 /ASSEMBLY_ACC=CAM_ASM_000868 /TAXON_ID=225041 /ORGANISM="Chlamydomonas chlamydogama, Strain SAG 11-48b" /LENGTH=373 /DNA_ID=CAMNT_0049574267 /DNA_START=80 /DNA_END=1201 /DNA_ORIENTATION=+
MSSVRLHGRSHTRSVLSHFAGSFLPAVHAPVRSRESYRCAHKKSTWQVHAVEQGQAGDVAESATSSSSPARGKPGSIYTQPELYKAAFSYRDISSEVSFLKEVYSRHTEGSELTSVLELGCGPGEHVTGLARAGVPRAVGLDKCPEMLAFARDLASGKAGGAAAGKKAKQAVGFGASSQQKPAPEPQQDQSGLPVPEFVAGDMTNFEIKGAPFDMVMCLLGTFSHMLDNSAAAACLRCAVRHLRPGGLLLLELGHPGDLFDGTYIIGDGGKEVWEVPQGKNKKIFVEWGAEFDNFDPVTQIIDRTVSISVLKGEEVEQSIEEVVPYRQYTVQELDLLATMTGLRIQQLYGEMNLEVDLSHEEAYRLIAVLRKL